MRRQHINIPGMVATAMLTLISTVLSYAADSGASQEIEEVLVTARYRKESLQEAPLAVTAFNEDTLDAIVAQDLRDVGPTSPNVHIQPVTTFPNSAAIHMRGMGQQNIESTSEMRIGVSVNGVFLSRPVASLIDFFDVESVEVLRGPQGTTFGKNSLAGGVAINTIRPDGTFDWKTEFTGGIDGRQDFRGAVQFPILKDKLSGRISLLSQNSDGHFKNRLNGNDLNGEDVDTLRATLVWTPTENFDATLIAHWLRDRSDAPGGFDRSDPNQLLPIIFGFTEPKDGKFRVGRDAPSFHNTDQSGVTLIANWDMGKFDLTSISGYQRTVGLIASDFDQTEIPFFPTFRDQHHYQFSQELRLHSDFSDLGGAWSNLDFVLGLFYFTQQHKLVQSFPTLGPSADYANQDANSSAIFGQAIYALTDRLNVTLGVRLTRDQKYFRRNPGAFAPGLIETDRTTRPSISQQARLPKTVRGKLDNYEATYKVGADFHINDDIMFYASFSQGYKAGEFGARAASDLTVGPTDDEESQSWEAGVKTDWWDKRIRANATVFLTDYRNLEFATFIPNDSNPTGQESSVQNIGKATTKGLELEVNLVPINGLILSGSLGLLDSKFDSFCADLDGPSFSANPVSNCGGRVVQLKDGSFLIDEDHTNLELSRAPNSEISLSLDYSHPTALGKFFVRYSGSYENNFFTATVVNGPKSSTGDVWTWDGRVGWQSNNESWKIFAWCKNCTDNVTIAGFVPVANFFNQAFWSAPRQWGVTLAWRQ